MAKTKGALRAQLPAPTSTEEVPGTGQVLKKWTRVLFLAPFDVALTTEMSRESVQVFTPEGGSQERGAPYPSGSVVIPEADVLALPSAPSFFVELYALAEEKLAVQAGTAKAAATPPAPPAEPEAGTESE